MDNEELKEKLEYLLGDMLTKRMTLVIDDIFTLFREALPEDKKPDEPVYILNRGINFGYNKAIREMKELLKKQHD